MKRFFIQRKALLIGGLIVVIIAGVTIGSLSFFQQRKPSQSPESESAIQSKKVPSKTLKNYTDPSGFSFQYPQDVSLERKENSDSFVYADIVFGSKDIKGSLELYIVDTDLKTGEQWFLQIPAGIDMGKLEDKKFGEIPAKERRTENSLTLAAVDEGVLFKIEVAFGNEKDYWTEVYNTLVASFSFSQPESSGGGTESSPSSDEVIFEGEEVIE